jgi:hypothetical protein
MSQKVFAAACSLACLAGIASAEIVRVEVTGEWDFGMVRSGVLNGVNSGPASMTFDVDSNVFTDSMSFPTRGYNIIEDSFVLTLDGISVGMPSPYPNGETPYFVLRDNDPAVDGFFLANNPNFPNGVFIDNAGLIAPNLTTLFSATYGGGTLSSLNILDAVGTYTFAGLSSFNWGLEDAGNQFAGMIFDQFTISVVPAPAAATLLAPAGLLAFRRRR